MPPPIGGFGHEIHPLSATVTVSEATGLRGVGPGTRCSLTVRYGETVNRLHCRATIACAGVTLYGTRQDSGFFACTAFSASPPLVVGTDGSTSASDGDPRLTIDTPRGVLTIADDARGALGSFSLTGSVTVTSPAPGAGYGS